MRITLAAYVLLANSMIITPPPIVIIKMSSQNSIPNITYLNIP